jgi:uncharacterized membrane protein YfcA
VASLTPMAPRPAVLPLVPLALAALAVVGAALLFGVGFGAVNPLYVLSGAFVGVLVGLTGVGGGSLMTPLLILLFGFHPSAAVGTDLIYASATKSVGTTVHAAGRTVDWRLVGRMALGSIPATLATVLAMHLLHLGGDKGSKALSLLLGGVLVVTAVALLARERLLAAARLRQPELSDRAAAGLTVALGAVLGVLITLTSVGAGALGVTLLVFLYPKLPTARIVGSDIVHAVPLTLIAGAAHWWMGSVNVGVLGSLLLGSIPGIVVGSALTPRVPEAVLRPILAVVLVLVGLKLIL